MELLPKRLEEAVETYWALGDQVDSLNPFSSYDTELRGPELRADLVAAGYLVATAADVLLTKLADV